MAIEACSLTNLRSGTGVVVSTSSVVVVTEERREESN